MDNRNLILAIVLSLAILLAFQWLVPTPNKPVRVPQNAAAVAAGQQAPGGVTSGPGGPPAGGPLANGPALAAVDEAAAASRPEALAKSPRLPIETARLSGSINLKGGRLDDLILRDYHETVDPASPAIVLLSPSGAARAYVAEQGWVASTPGVKTPDDDTLWTTDATKLTDTTPVTLTWDNGAGLVFSRQVSVDANYMFTVRDSVVNHGNDAVTLRAFALAERTGPPPVSSTWLSYEGPIGAFNGVEEDVKYTSIVEGVPVRRDSTGGWLGFSDKYWLGAIAPVDQGLGIVADFKHSGTGFTQRYQVDYLGPEQSAAAGATISSADYVFAGPKEVRLLAQYRDALKLPRFDNAVDFGWFWFFTKPIFYGLDWVYQAVGNFGVAILILTVVMRALFFPLQTRAVINMNKMKVLQPEVAKLRELYGEDKVKLNQETMALYKRVGANPVAGCLPILVQIPVFFSLYKVLFVSIEMRHAPFFGWIRDLSAPDPTSMWTAFGALPWDAPHFLPQIGIWPLLYGGSMFLQQRLNPAPADPVQARMLQFMPLILMFTLANFPAGLVIYWTWSNILVLVQQYVITRHLVATPKT